MSLLRNHQLIILLGADSFPYAPSLRASETFLNSYRAVKNYFIHNFSINEEENILDLFNSEKNALELNLQICDWLQGRLKKENGEKPPISLFIYYVGHGAFGSNNSQYYLALKTTRNHDPLTFSFSIYALSKLLNEYAGNMSRFLIIDACFAAAAVENLMSPLDEAVGQRVHQLTAHGTSILCASAASEVAMMGEYYTHFSEAMLYALENGDILASEFLSLRNVKDIASRFLNLQYPDRCAVPQVHSPDQYGGADLAETKLFFNKAYKINSEIILSGHTDHVDCAAWSRDGQFIATGSYDNNAIVWSLSGKLLHTLRSHSLGVCNVAWSPMENLLATGSYDKTVCIWEMVDETFSIKHKFYFSDEVRALDWAPQGRFLLVGLKTGGCHFIDTQLYVVNLVANAFNFWINDVACHWADERGINHVAIAIGNPQVIIRSLVNPEVNIEINLEDKLFHEEKNYNARPNSKSTHRIGIRTYTNAIAFSKKTDFLAIGSGNGNVEIWKWWPQPSTLITTLNKSKGKIVRIDFSKDGNFIAVQSEDRTVVYSCDTWEAVLERTGPFPTQTRLPLAIHPQKNLFASAYINSQQVVISKI